MAKERKDFSIYKQKTRGLSFTFDVSNMGDKCVKLNGDQTVIAYFVSKRRINKKALSIEELEVEIHNCSRAKMVMIMINEEYSRKVKEMLNKLSRERGICSPIIEKDKVLLYFPQLRYSDMGLLDYICIHCAKLDNYSLKMTGTIG